VREVSIAAARRTRPRLPPPIGAEMKAIKETSRRSDVASRWG
jgi:hypothetical protein